MKDEKKHHGAVDEYSSEQLFHKLKEGQQAVLAVR